MKTLYKLHFDCGGQGVLHGLFVAEEDSINELIENETIIYFGEVLGKNSEVMGPIEENDITIITTDEKVIAVIEHYDLGTGYNPFDYMEVDEEDLEDTDV